MEQLRLAQKKTADELEQLGTKDEEHKTNIAQLKEDHRKELENRMTVSDSGKRAQKNSEDELMDDAKLITKAHEHKKNIAQLKGAQKRNSGFSQWL